MWLLYLAEAHRWRYFRQFYGVTRRTFYKDGQFSYRYDPRSGKRYGVNATLDDLRIIRALLVYAQMAGARNPYGDGHATERILAAIQYHFGVTSTRPSEFS